MDVEQDANFVNSVMAPQNVTHVESGTIDNSDLKILETNSTPHGDVAEGTSSRKRCLSSDGESDDSVENNKKLKSQSAVSPDFTIMMNWMKQELDDVKSDLTKTIDSRVNSLEVRLRDTMLTVVKEEVDKARSEFNDRINGLASKLENKIRQSVENKIETKLKQATDQLKSDIDLKGIKQDITTVKKSYADIAKSEIGIESDIVIRNYISDPREADEPQLTLNKVNSLLRDGLKFADIKVTKCERKKSRGSKPGVIIATVATREQKQKVLDNKKKLRNIQQFSKVYIEDARPLTSRINEANMLTVLQELDKKDQYFMSSNGRLLKKNNNHSNHSNQ
ncbi:MAG: hypothetical protein AB2693_31290 [Candidatus Thiodiazotropha sp.]